MPSEPCAQSSWRCTIRLNSLLPKRNEHLSDCQDSTGADAHSGRFCISDGATQSFFSNLWSQELCNSFCASASVVNSSNWREWLEAAQVNWHQLVTDRCASLQLEKKVSWIECSNGLSLKKPAYATFLGFSIENDYLKGISIGDSFAFLLKVKNVGNDLPVNQITTIERIFPGLWNPIFSNRTEGLSSYTADTDHKPEFFEIPICPSVDSAIWILMMSDALASYTCDAEHKGSSILSDLVQLSSPAQFEQFVGELRANGMGDDDTSLLCIQVERDAQPTISNHLFVIDDPATANIQPIDPKPQMPADPSVTELELPVKDDSIDVDTSFKPQVVDCLIDPPTGEHLLNTSDISSTDIQPSGAILQLPSGSSIPDSELQASDTSIDAAPPLKQQEDEGPAPDYVDHQITNSLSNSPTQFQLVAEDRVPCEPSLPRLPEPGGEIEGSKPLQSQLIEFTKIFKWRNNDD